ncbi:glutathione S-transferase [Cryphonectria parasitica EP155]|uniref:Glutathione S-transferase n=1 Tax=Cryphonectria parasitica (strain ATCC 38755 / EP155) TaxID=660469 RepID=A0A9P4XYV7_CRYP1|nr:glutathione S-transferase [Cryphonectria parasitica EP155]KAF3763436.1 glutathione S-transferase [Cryphonectria parasitica EP155]
MTSQLKPIKLWGHAGPNPIKVAIVLEELGIPYETENIPFSEVKKLPYVAINPNGRVPAIEDPNSGLTLWESGAIIEYLIEKYDTDNKLSFPRGSKEDYLARQWLYFQVSGQGPYYGQAVWFNKFHQEKLPSAVERYVNEIGRVTHVLEGYLAAQKAKGGSDGPWLVGNKLSFADLAFIPWQNYTLTGFIEGFDATKYPVVKEWLEKMLALPSVQAALPKEG